MEGAILSFSSLFIVVDCCATAVVGVAGALSVVVASAVVTAEDDSISVFGSICCCYCFFLLLIPCSYLPITSALSMHGVVRSCSFSYRFHRVMRYKHETHLYNAYITNKTHTNTYTHYHILQTTVSLPFSTNSCLLDGQTDEIRTIITVTSHNTDYTCITTQYMTTRVRTQA